MNKKLTITLTALFILLLSQNLSALSGRDIMEKVKEESSPKTTHAAIQLDIVGKNGVKKTRILEMWTRKNSKGLNRSLINFIKPSSIKGTRFLIVENKGRPDDQHIYLPALKRVRRIAASARNKSFMGTEFTYSDMSSRNIDEDTYTILREETYNGHDCYVVESIPKHPGSYHYSKTIIWVAKDIRMILKVEMYDTNGKLKKVLTMNNFKKINGYWTPYKTVMKNIQSGRSTILTNLKIEYDKNIPADMFTVQFLKRGKMN